MAGTVRVRYKGGVEDKFLDLDDVLDNLLKTMDEPSLWGSRWNEKVPLSGRFTNYTLKELVESMRKYLTDGSLTFNVSTSGEDLQPNLIMPEPCPFLSRKFPVCSIIRPVSTDPNIFGAMAAVKGLTADGLFTGQTNNQFFTKLHDLAEDADNATRKCHRED